MESIHAYDLLKSEIFVNHAFIDMKKNDFNDLSIDELIQKKTAFKEELHKLNYQRKAGRVDKPHLFSMLKKDIARIETVISRNKNKTTSERNS